MSAEKLNLYPIPLIINKKGWEQRLILRDKILTKITEVDSLFDELFAIAEAEK